MTTTVSAAPENESAHASASGPGGPDRPDRPERGWFGRLLLRLHFYAGLLVGPFLLVAAVSGALYAITPTIEEAVYKDELHAPVTDTRLPIGDQVDIARAHVAAADSGADMTDHDMTDHDMGGENTSGGDMSGHDMSGDAAAGGATGDAAEVDAAEVWPSAVRPAPEPGDTTRVMFADENLGESESRAVFVDPGTGEVRGDLTVYGTSGALPLRTWFDQLHRSLHLGDFGRLYSELAASWLSVVALAGLGLWIRRVRRSRNKVDFVRPARGRTGYRRLFGWHTSLGTWVLLGALFLSATGVTWSQYAGTNVTDLRAALDWGTPAIDPHIPGKGSAQDGAGADGGEHAEHGGGSTDSDAGDEAGEHAEHGAGGGDDAGGGAADGGASAASSDPALFDAVLGTAQGINVNTGLVEIVPPAEPGTAWVVTEIQRSYPTEVDAVAVDGETLQMVHRVDFAEFSLPAKLARWGIDLHMGSMFGFPNQLVLFVIASSIGAMVVLGYLMWWKRRPTRDPRRLAGTPPRRGALQGAPWWGIGAVLTGAIFIGWWLPLVGWTLAGFVVIDVVVGLVGLVGRRRARTS